MHLSKRQSAILDVVRLHGSFSVRDLAERMSVSDETIRRAVKQLSARGLVRKVHGAVELPDGEGEPPFERRMRVCASAKRAIAARAAKFVADGDSLMLDTGSTTAYVAQALARHANLTVVTNSAEIARTLATRNGNRVFMAGGELRADDAAAFGPAALAFIGQFKVRTAILSIGAIHAEQGLMDYHLCEGEFSRAVMACAERTLVVADHSKFGRSGFVQVCPVEDIDVLITDLPPPAPFSTRLQGAGVEVVVIGAENP